MTPDAELIVISVLLDASDVTDRVGVEVGSSIPAKPAWPRIRVTRLGGQAVDVESNRLDAAFVQVEAFADTKEDAFFLIGAARDALHAATGLVADAVVSTIRLGNLVWLPDTTYEPPRSRYVQDVTVYAHA